MSFLHLFLVGLLVVGSIAGPVPVPDLSAQPENTFQAGSKEDNQAGTADGYTNEGLQATQYSPGDGTFQASNTDGGERVQADSGLAGGQQVNTQPVLYNQQGTTGSQASPTGTVAFVPHSLDRGVKWNPLQSSRFYMGALGTGFQPLRPMQQPTPLGSPDVTPTVPFTGPAPNQGAMPAYPLYANQPFYTNTPGFVVVEQYTPIDQLPIYTMTNTQQAGYNTPADYNPSQVTQVAQQPIPQQQQAQTLEPAGQQATLQNAGQANDPLNEILPSVITEKRRLGDEEPQFSQPASQVVQPTPMQQTVPQVVQQTVQPVVGYQTPSPVQQPYTEEQFPSLITLKGHNYLVVPQKYFSPYGGAFPYGYQHPYAILTPYSSYTPYSPYSPYSSYAYTHTVPVVVNPYGVPAQQRYQLVPVTYSQTTGSSNLYSGLTTVKVLVKTDDGHGYHKPSYQNFRPGEGYARQPYYEEYGGYPRQREYQPYVGHQGGTSRQTVYPRGYTLTSGYRVGDYSYQPRITYPYQYSSLSGKVQTPAQPMFPQPTVQAVY